MCFLTLSLVVQTPALKWGLIFKSRLQPQSRHKTDDGVRRKRAPTNVLFIRPVRDYCSVSRRSDTAILYNDRSVLESHHVSAAYRLLQDDDEMNILYNLSKDDWRWVGLTEMRLLRAARAGSCLSFWKKSVRLALILSNLIDLLYKHEDLVFSPQHAAVYFSSCLIVLPGSWGLWWWRWCWPQICRATSSRWRPWRTSSNSLRGQFRLRSLTTTTLFHLGQVYYDCLQLFIPQKVTRNRILLPN